MLTGLDSSDISDSPSKKLKFDEDSKPGDSESGAPLIPSIKAL
jgi:hypothetical protein